MTISPTDTPKRLSDEQIADIERYLRFVIDGGMDHDGPELMELLKGTHRAAKSLLSHIAALTAFSTQGNVERAEAIYAEQLEKHGQTVSYQKDVAIAAITQALTESSGQGVDGACCEAMREAAAKIVEGEVVHHRFRQWPWYGSGNEDQQNERVRFCDGASKAIRALPIPVSADGAWEVSADILAAAWEVVTYPNYMTVEECERNGQTPGPGNRLKTALLKSKQPSDAGAGK